MPLEALGLSASVELNHTIVFARDRRESAEFFAGLLNLEIGEPSGPFLPVRLRNNVRLDFAEIEPDKIALQHYAFLIPEEDFDAFFERLKASGVAYQADPHGKQVGEINYNHGGRGVYFYDPAGHGLEVITQPYENVVTES